MKRIKENRKRKVKIQLINVEVKENEILSAH